MAALLAPFLALAFLYATLRPHAPPERAALLNQVERQDGVAVYPAPGILQSRSAPVWLLEAMNSGWLWVIVELRPASSSQEGPARVFTISENTALRNLTIGQEQEDLVVRLRRNGHSPNGVPPYVVPAVFNGEATTVYLKITERQLEVYVDGVRRLLVPVEDPLSFWNRFYPVALGNELTGNRAWLGVISRAVVITAGGRYDLLQPDALHAPCTLTQPAISWVSSNPTDLFLNLILMVPIGFASSAALSRWPRRRLVALWAVLVVTVEACQIFIPGRFASLSDVILNLGGIWLGATLARWQFRARAT